MGFKYKKVTFTVGDGTYPNISGSTDYAGLRAREQAVVKGVVQAIIDCNEGWALDTTRNATMDDFFDVPRVDRASSYWKTGLFLTNSTSGNKLFICYVNGQKSAGICYASGGNVSRYDDGYAKVYNSSANGYTAICGLIMSMIPGDANQSFGQTLDNTFLPTSATRFIGTMSGPYYNSSTTNYGYIVTNSSGFTFNYRLLVTPYCIAVGKEDSGMGTPHGVLSYAIGRILGTLANSTDTSAQSKYGTIVFTNATSNYSSSALNEGSTYMFRSSYTAMTSFSAGSSSLSIYGLTPNTTWKNDFGASGATPAFAFNSVARVDGTWIQNDAHNGVAMTYDCVSSLCPVTNSQTDNSARWVPIAMQAFSDDLTTYGVVTGDGFKGYLDTDLFRIAYGTLGQLWNNGAFLSLENYLMIGWNSANESW